MPSEYMENKSKCGSIYGCGAVYELYQKMNHYEPFKAYFSLNPDSVFISTEREQRQERSKIVRQIIHDDYMKKYGNGTP